MIDAFRQERYPAGWVAEGGWDQPPDPDQCQLHDRTLLITCSEHDLSGALRRLATPRTLVWRTPGATLPTAEPGRGRKAPSLAYTLLTHRVAEVIVLGHSRCDCVRRLAPEPAAVTAEGMERIMHNMRRSGRLRRQVMDHVREQVEAIQRHPDLDDPRLWFGVSVQGWVYLDETGTFLMYDALGKGFLPVKA